MATDPPTETDTTEHRPTTRHTLFDALLAVSSPSRLLYGAVVSAAVLAVVDVHTETPANLLFTMASVLVVYWLVHLYVEVLAQRLVARRNGSRQRLRAALHNETGILLGGLPTVLVVGASFLFGASVSLATNIGLWLSVLLLAIAGFRGAHRVGLRGWRLLAETAGAGLFGVLAIVLKTLLHH